LEENSNWSFIVKPSPTEYSMHVISEIEFKTKVEPILRQVFLTDDPFGPPLFSSSIIERGILYTYAEKDEDEDKLGCSISINALISAATKLGDEGCYISSPLIPVEFPDAARHCYVPFSEFYAGYTGSQGESNLIGVKTGVNPYHSCIFFSPRALWGIFLCEGPLGLIGGPKKFMEEIYNVQPDLYEHVYRYIKYLRPTEGIASTILLWLPVFLIHIYGQDKATKLLFESGWFHEYLELVGAKYSKLECIPDLLTDVYGQDRVARLLSGSNWFYEYLNLIRGNNSNTNHL